MTQWCNNICTGDILNKKNDELKPIVGLIMVHKHNNTDNIIIFTNV